MQQNLVQTVLKEMVLLGVMGIVTGSMQNVTVRTYHKLSKDPVYKITKFLPLDSRGNLNNSVHSIYIKNVTCFPVSVPEGSCICNPGYQINNDCSGMTEN